MPFGLNAGFSLTLRHSMHVLYEDNGGFKVGTVLSASDATLQVESPHGKRSKIKTSAILLRFEAPAPSELMNQAEARAAEIDVDFLWECCSQAEFGFAELAKEYCGHEPAAVEAAGILLKLHSAPVYFYRKGKGRYRAAPPEVLKAALEGIEKKRQIQARIDAWVAELSAGRLPDELRPFLQEFLYKPDRNKAEIKALERACEAANLSPARLMERCGALPSSHDYHLGRFLHEFFPRGTGFPRDLLGSLPKELPLAQVSAFSLDDAGTTEIDDAFSITPLGEGKIRIGIHIAAPGLGFLPGSNLDAVARGRLSTVYFPGSKITMLPYPVIEQFSLKQGGPHPAVSLYVDVLEDGFEILNRHSVVELLPVAANIRHHETELLDAILASGGAIPELPYASELHFLWRFATSLETARGKPSNTPERPEYSFQVEGERVDIVMRRRGAPMDKLVAELMVLVNSTWGKLLDDHDVPAVYRVQAGGKVRMSTGAGGHQGLGVSHYAWASSPLRRYIDLINQWQLLALLGGEDPPFRKNDAELLAAVSEFEASYAAYGDFQRAMEHYWSLRWLVQENRSIVTAELLKENLVRLDGLPVILRVPSMPELAPGTRVELAINDIDLIENVLKCRFVQALEPALT